MYWRSCEEKNTETVELQVTIPDVFTSQGQCIPLATSNLIENIKKDILKSGFPLELEVLSICSTKNVGRQPNIQYVYGERLHEIDLAVQFENFVGPYSSGQNLQYTRTIMIIECKKSTSKPWVFFSSPLYQGSPEAGRVSYFSDFNLYFNKVERHSLLGQIVGLLKHDHYNDSSIPRCIKCSIPFDPPNKKNEIFDGITSVLSFLNYCLEGEESRASMSGCTTTFFFPVIVLDGLLYEAIVENNDVTLCERPHILYTTRYGQNIFFVDVVTKDHFSKFLDMIEVDHKEFVSCINTLDFPDDHKTAVTNSDAVLMAQRAKEREKGIDYDQFRIDPATGRRIYVP